jgi:hypothetical protein
LAAHIGSLRDLVVGHPDLVVQEARKITRVAANQACFKLAH